MSLYHYEALFPYQVQFLILISLYHGLPRGPVLKTLLPTQGVRVCQSLSRSYDPTCLRHSQKSPSDSAKLNSLNRQCLPQVSQVQEEVLGLTQEEERDPSKRRKTGVNLEGTRSFIYYSRCQSGRRRGTIVHTHQSQLVFYLLHCLQPRKSCPKI